MKSNTQQELAAFKAAHVYALLDLNRYALDCQQDADRLNPLIRATSLAAMVQASPALQQYRANSTFIENLYDALIGLAVRRMADESAGPDDSDRVSLAYQQDDSDPMQLGGI